MQKVLRLIAPETLWRPGHRRCHLTLAPSIPPTDQQAASLLRSVNRERRRPSLNDFAQEFEYVVSQNRVLALRLNEAVDEKAALDQLHQQACAEFDRERARLNAEIANLRAQISGGVHSVGAARERLLRDECERKLQELTIQLRSERKMYIQAVDEMKKQIANCLCRATTG